MKGISTAMPVVTVSPGIAPTTSPIAVPSSIARMGAGVSTLGAAAISGSNTAQPPQIMPVGSGLANSRTNTTQTSTRNPAVTGSTTTGTR